MYKQWMLRAVTAFAMAGALSSAHAATFVYVGSSDSQDVAVFSLNKTGELLAVETVPIPGPTKPGASLPLAISPDKRFLFAGLRNEPYTVATFAIDAKSGKLKYVGSGPLADSMAYIGTDRTGRFLFGASYGGHKVTVNPIGANGVVGQVQQVIATKPNAHAILPDPSNRYVLHTSLGGDVVHQQRFDAKTGLLSANSPDAVSVKPKAGPRHLVFAPNGKFVYLLNELDASLYVFSYDAASGTLGKELQVVDTLPKGFATDKPWAADLHLTPDGKFLYASERRSSTLAAFRVGGDGTLALVDNYPTEKQPRGFNIDPSGRYLLAAGQLSNSMTSYEIDGKSGKLTKLKEYPVGKNPNWVEIVTFR